MRWNISFRLAALAVIASPVEAANPDAFAAHSCKLISKRARSNPALDRNGKPIKSYFVSAVRWQIGS